MPPKRALVRNEFFVFVIRWKGQKCDDRALLTTKGLQEKTHFRWIGGNINKQRWRRGCEAFRFKANLLLVIQKFSNDNQLSSLTWSKLLIKYLLTWKCYDLLIFSIFHNYLFYNMLKLINETFKKKIKNLLFESSEPVRVVWVVWSWLAAW